MRLMEFESEPPIKTALRKYIRDGYKRIGEPSASAAVFAAPDYKNVIKIGKLSDCWLKYAKVAKGSSNDHLPKIFSIEIHGNYYLAEMEFLRELPDNFFKNETYRKIAAWMNVVGGWANGRDVYLHDQSKVQIAALASALAKEQPEMVDALKIVVRTRGGCNFDCHPTNMMQRANNELVLTDPLTHQG